MADTRKNVDIYNLSTNLTKLLHANKLFIDKDLQWTSKFSRFGVIDYYNKLDTSKEYVFFTKPDINLFSNNGHQLTEDAARNPIIYDIYKKYPHMLKQLQLSASTGPFINVLTNSLMNTADVPGITSEVLETSSTVYGSKLFYRKHSFKSDEGHELGLEFQDTKYLEIYAMFKALDEYIRMRSMGTIKAKDTYIQNNILDDQIAIYKFIVASDHTTILFYAKFTGCFPTTVPREAFSELDEKLIYSIPFKTTWVEDMDPTILFEFNNLVKNTSGSAIPLYNKDLGHVNGQWVNMPYISISSTGKNKLMWR